MMLRLNCLQTYCRLQSIISLENINYTIRKKFTTKVFPTNSVKTPTKPGFLCIFIAWYRYGLESGHSDACCQILFKRLWNLMSSKVIISSHNFKKRNKNVSLHRQHSANEPPTHTICMLHTVCSRFSQKRAYETVLWIVRNRPWVRIRIQLWYFELFLFISDFLPIFIP